MGYSTQIFFILLKYIILYKFKFRVHPIELVFGRKPNEIEALNQPIVPVYNFENYIKMMKNILQICHKRAKEFIEKSKLKKKTNI